MIKIEELLLRSVVEDINRHIENVQELIKNEELSGFKAREVVDSLISKAYGTRSDILGMIRKDLKDDELKYTAKLIYSLINTNVAKALEASELLDSLDIDSELDKIVESNNAESI